MLKAVATIRTITLLLAGTLAVQAYASDITFTMSEAAPYCKGSNATLSYTATGETFTANNVFTVQLSNAVGSFAVPTVIGTLATTALTGDIPVTFPSSADGTQYRIRVIASHPSVVGSDNGFDITIDLSPVALPTVSITAEPTTTVGAGSPIYFAATITNGGNDPLYEWKKNGNVVGGSANAFVLDNPADGDEIELSVTSSLACASPTMVTSSAITVDVDVNLTKSNHSWQERASQFSVSTFINRSNASGFSFGAPTSKLYIACGSSSLSAYHNDLWAYDPATDTWAQKSSLPGPGRYNAVALSANGKGYLGTGMGAGAVLLNDFYEYEPTGNSWIVRSAFPGTAREQAFGFGVGTLAYIGGGVSGGTDFSNVYEFNTGTNLWSGPTEFGGGKRIGAATFVVGVKAYVFGGYSSTTKAYYNDLWEYSSSTWTQRASMPGSGRTRATAFALAGNGYVGLGYSGDVYDGTFYKYDVVGNTWTQKASFPGPTTFTYGVGLTVNNRAFVYKDGKHYEYDLFTTTPFPSKICTTETIPVSFDASGFSFNANNVFTAQLSSAPDFSVKTTLASLPQSSPSGTINAYFPPTLSNGTYYFRIQSSNPQINTLVETITITKLTASHIIDSESGSIACKGNAVVFESSLAGPGFQWYKNDEAVGSDEDSYVDAALENDDVIKCVRTYETGCTGPVGVTSNLIIMTVRDPEKPTITVTQPNTLNATSATQYQWYKNGETILNANAQTYRMTESGVYKVRTSDSGGCFAFSDDLAGAFTGLEDTQFSVQVSAYPSPFSNDMYLSLADDIVAQGCDFSLMNELGQTVINKQAAQKFNKLDLTGRAPGLYVLRVSFGPNTVVRRLLKID